MARRPVLMWIAVVVVISTGCGPRPWPGERIDLRQAFLESEPIEWHGWDAKGDLYLRGVLSPGSAQHRSVFESFDAVSPKVRRPPVIVPGFPIEAVRAYVETDPASECGVLKQKFSQLMVGRSDQVTLFQPKYVNPVWLRWSGQRALRRTLEQWTLVAPADNLRELH